MAMAKSIKMYLTIFVATTCIYMVLYQYHIARQPLSAVDVMKNTVISAVSTNTKTTALTTTTTTTIASATGNGRISALVAPTTTLLSSSVSPSSSPSPSPMPSRYNLFLWSPFALFSAVTATTSSIAASTTATTSTTASKRTATTKATSSTTTPISLPSTFISSSSLSSSSLQKRTINTLNTNNNNNNNKNNNNDHKINQHTDRSSSSNNQHNNLITNATTTTITSSQIRNIKNIANSARMTNFNEMKSQNNKHKNTTTKLINKHTKLSVINTKTHKTNNTNEFNKINTTITTTRTTRERNATTGEIRKGFLAAVEPPPLYIITPTYRRPEQLAELTRLGYTLKHVTNLLWLVIEDANKTSELVTLTLNRIAVPYEYLVAPMPEEYKQGKKAKPRGVSNRNRGLEWLRQNASEGVFYFADDDNTYDINIFEQMRYTKKVSMWPVGLVTKTGVSSPIIRNGKIDGFYDGWIGGRKFPVDMAGFAVSVKFLQERPTAKMPYKPGYEEDGFLKSLAPLNVTEIELLASDCTEILTWHTQTKKNQPAAPLNMTKYKDTNLVYIDRMQVRP